MKHKPGIVLLIMCMLQCLLFRAQVATVSVTKTYVETTPVKELEIPALSSKQCANINAVNVIIEEAITIGAPTYNNGNHTGCFRIYEGAAYKILYKYGSKCSEVKNVLEAALEKAYGDYSSTEKAWIMRQAFDLILGVPTQTQEK
jgi:hypothetical protein